MYIKIIICYNVICQLANLQVNPFLTLERMDYHIPNIFMYLILLFSFY